LDYDLSRFCRRRDLTAGAKQLDGDPALT